MNIDNIALDQVEAFAQSTKKVGVKFDDDGDPTVGFVIVSKDSKQYRDAASLVRAAAIRRQTNKRTRIDRSTEEGALELDSVLQENEFELALSVVVGWFGFTESDGNGGQKPAEFSKDRVAQMFKVKPTWREKVSASLEEEEGFLAI